MRSIPVHQAKLAGSNSTGQVVNVFNDSYDFNVNDFYVNMYIDNNDLKW